MGIDKFFKETRFKIFKYLLKTCFKSELKENIMRKYYVSYIIVNPNQGAMPSYGDTFIDIDGKITMSAIKNIKKQILDNYLKYAPKIPGLTNNVNIVLNCIEDITKEEISNAINAFNDKSNNTENSTKDYFMPGAIEIVNGKKYIGGKEIVE